MNRVGHTRIAPHALKRTVEAVAATAFGIAPGQVAVSLDDHQGKLGVDLTVRLPAPPLLGTPAPAAPLTREVPAGELPAGKKISAFEQAQIARLKVAILGRQITGMDLGRINIRVAAAKHRKNDDARVDQAGTRRTTSNELERRLP